ncbi:MAG: tRNA epoxyqueuosine(34) reductase QueG [Bacilli bacterium]|nr:tRNA epoxyqueuosine(34) reductase QueG [Bacilli bacterium]
MLKDAIIEYSKKINIDLIGFCDPYLPDKLHQKLLLQKDLNYKCEFQNGTIEEQTNPLLIMSNCKTIIAIGLAYPNKTDKLNNLSVDEVYFSSSSWGKDYHGVLKEKMTLLCNYIKQTNPTFEYKIICDTSPLCDRTIAYQAGLGFFGKNNLLINQEYGSNIFLGSILTNLVIPVDKPLDTKCKDNCFLCINACPTKAISEVGIINSNKCLSYITQKKELSIAEEKLINQCVYGCDICRNACPYNKRSNNIHEEFKPTNLEFININDYIPLSNKDFKDKYGHLAMAWRGPKIINRNIKIYKEQHLKNASKDISF